MITNNTQNGRERILLICGKCKAVNAYVPGALSRYCVSCGTKGLLQPLEARKPETKQQGQRGGVVCK